MKNENLEEYRNAMQTIERLLDECDWKELKERQREIGMYQGILTLRIIEEKDKVQEEPKMMHGDFTWDVYEQ